MDKLDLFDNYGIYWKEGNKEFLLRANQAEDPDNPRDGGLNIGHMTCWHRRYRLGDHHEYESPYQFLIALARKHVPNQAVTDALKAGKLSVTLKAPNNPKLIYHLGQGTLLADFADGFKAENTVWAIYHRDGYEFIEAATEDALAKVLWGEGGALTFGDLQTLLGDYVVLLPLWLYDHSGITMSCGDRTGQYADRWDSGQVGWIWTTKGEILENFPDANEDNWKETAQEVLEAEVELYDQYLTGDVYDYRLYQKENGQWVEDDDWVEECFGSDIFSNGLLESLEYYGFKDIREALQTNSCVVGPVKTETVTRVVGVC